jgi:hypothetical protein
MLVRDRIREGNDKATRDAKAMGIFSENQLEFYGNDISFLLGTNINPSRQKISKRKNIRHENYGHDDTTQSSLRL